MDKGFTLIEIVVILVILAIIAIVAIPKITSITESRQLIAADKIQADLRWAQQFAINRNCKTRVAFNTGTESYTITENSSGAFVTAINPTTRENFIVQLNTGQYSGVVIGSVTFDGQATVEFNSIGRPYAYNGATSIALAATGTVILTPALSIDVTPETGKVGITK